MCVGVLVCVCTIHESDLEVLEDGQQGEEGDKESECHTASCGGSSVASHGAVAKALIDHATEATAVDARVLLAVVGALTDHSLVLL